MMNTGKRRVLGEINKNCENQTAQFISSSSCSSSSGNMVKKIQIPKLVNKKKIKNKNVDELWKKLQEIIEANVEDANEKANAYEIIEILKSDNSGRKGEQELVTNPEEKKKKNFVIYETTPNDDLCKLSPLPVVVEDLPTFPSESPKMEPFVDSPLANSENTQIFQDESSVTPSNSDIIAASLPLVQQYESTNQQQQTSTSTSAKSSDLIFDEFPITNERAKRRHRRASIVASHESPAKISKNQEHSVKEEVAASSQNKYDLIETTIQEPQSTTIPDFPDEIDDGLIHWNPNTSPVKNIYRTTQQSVAGPSNSLAICQEKIGLLSLAPSSTSFTVEDNFISDQLNETTVTTITPAAEIGIEIEPELETGTAPKTKGRRGRRKSVSAAKFQSRNTKKIPDPLVELTFQENNENHNDNENQNEIENHERKQNLSPESDEYFHLQSGDDCDVGFLHWTSELNQPPPLTRFTSDSSVTSVQSVTSDNSIELSRSKRRQRRASVSISMESPKKLRKTRTNSSKSKEIEIEGFKTSNSQEFVDQNPSQETFLTPQKRRGGEIMNSPTPCVEDDLFQNLDMTSPSNDSHILTVTSQQLNQIFDLLNHQYSQSTTLSSGEIILSACLASLLAKDTNNLIPSSLQYFLPLFQSFSRLAADQANTNDSLQNKSRKIKFDDEFGGGCKSPPNDRKPGSCHTFQQNSLLLATLLSFIDVIIENERNSHEFSLLMDQFRLNLHSLSQDKKCSLHVLDIYSKSSKGIIQESTSLPSSQELGRISLVLHDEITFRCMSSRFPVKAREMIENSNRCSVINPLYLPFHTPQIGHYRTTLRHQSTWTTVSVIRYHLRWLLDDPPLRAEKVQLLGSSPLQSSRSMMTQVTIITHDTPSNSPRAEPFEITLSSALTLALQQIYNGLGDSISLNKQQSIPTLSSQLLFDQLQNTIPLFQQKIHEKLLHETLSNYDLLHFAQIMLAAEKGRQFISSLLTNSVIETIGKTSGVWDVIEEHSEILLMHGLQEDYHLSLLSNISLLKQLVSQSFIPIQFIKPLEKIVFQKITKANPKQQPPLVDKSDLKELIDLCPYLFRFPQLRVAR